jgi:hypothetical protein
LQQQKKQALNGATGKSSKSSSKSPYGLESTSGAMPTNQQQQQQQQQQAPANHLMPQTTQLTATGFPYSAAYGSNTPTSANNVNASHNNSSNNSNSNGSNGSNTSNGANMSNVMHLSAPMTASNSAGSNASLATSGNRLMSLAQSDDSALNNNSANTVNRHQMMNSRLKTLIQSRQQNGSGGSGSNGGGGKGPQVGYSPNASPGLASYNGKCVFHVHLHYAFVKSILVNGSLKSSSIRLAFIHLFSFEFAVFGALQQVEFRFRFSTQS